MQKNRQVNLRKPRKLPLEEDLSIVRCHLIKTMNDFNDEYEFQDVHAYVTLRNVVCARLTLLCGRMGGEPAHMLLEDWIQAKNGE